MDRNAKLDHALNNAVEAQNLYNLSAIQGTPGVYESTPTPQQAQMNDLVDAITKNRQQPKQPSEPTQPKFNFNLGPQAKVLAEWANSDDPELQNKALRYFVKAFPNDEARKDFYHTVAANYGPKNKRLSVNPYIADKGAKILNNASMMFDNEEGKLDLGTKESDDVYGGQSGGLDRQDYGKKVPTSSTKYERLLGVADADGIYQNQYDMIHTDDIDNYLSDYEKTVNKIKSNEIPSDDEDSPFLSAEEKAETQMEDAGENPFQHKRALRQKIYSKTPADKYMQIGDYFGSLAGDAMTNRMNNDIQEDNNQIDANRDKLRNEMDQMEIDKLKKQLYPTIEAPDSTEMDFIGGNLPDNIRDRIADIEARQQEIANGSYSIRNSKDEALYKQAVKEMERLQKEKLDLVNFKHTGGPDKINNFNGGPSMEEKSEQETFDKVLSNVKKGKDYDKGTSKWYQILHGRLGDQRYNMSDRVKSMGEAMQNNLGILSGYVKAEGDGKVLPSSALNNLAYAYYNSGQKEKSRRYLSLWNKAQSLGVNKVFSMTDPTMPNEKMWYGFTRDGKFVIITPEGADATAVANAPESVAAGAGQIYKQ